MSALPKCRMNIIMAIFFAVWVVILLFVALPSLLLTPRVATSTSETADRLAKALTDLEALRKQNNELQELFRDIKLG